MKQNALIGILFLAFFVMVVVHTPSKLNETDCDSDYVTCDVWPEGLDEIIKKYRSPVVTPAISFKDFDMSIRELPPLPSEEEWLDVLDSVEFRQRFEGDVKKYGDFVKRYYSSSEYNYLYIEVSDADLTSDGRPENIVSFAGGGSFGVEKYEIVEGDKVIATIKSPSVGRGGVFIPDSSGNGFSITWYQGDMFPDGYCCPVAQMVTKFVFEDGTFKPVSEQKILKPQDEDINSDTMPVAVGTKWTYEGNRLFYDRDTQKNSEVIAQKVVEVTDIEEVEGGVKIHTRETYTNDPDFTERTKSYLISESGFDFGIGEPVDLPLTLNQVLQELDVERDDNLYSTYVSRVHTEHVLGKEYQCYDISSNTLADTAFQTFCEGIGYVRDYYKHHGTPNDSDYKLVSIGVN